MAILIKAQKRNVGCHDIGNINERINIYEVVKLTKYCLKVFENSND